jgi:hypothetical protein
MSRDDTRCKHAAQKFTAETQRAQRKPRTRLRIRLRKSRASEGGGLFLAMVLELFLVVGLGF